MNPKLPISRSTEPDDRKCAYSPIDICPEEIKHYIGKECIILSDNGNISRGEIHSASDCCLFLDDGKRALSIGGILFLSVNTDEAVAPKLPTHSTMINPPKDRQPSETQFSYICHITATINSTDDPSDPRLLPFSHPMHPMNCPELPRHSIAKMLGESANPAPPRQPIDPPARRDGRPDTIMELGPSRIVREGLTDHQRRTLIVRDWILIGGSIAMIGALCMARFVWIPLFKCLL